jgi:hypothetical protein
LAIISDDEIETEDEDEEGEDSKSGKVAVRSINRESLAGSKANMIAHC